MHIIKVTDKPLADGMLTSLIMDERQYDRNISEKFRVSDWYSTTLDNEQLITFAAIDEGEIIELYKKHGFIPLKSYMRNEIK